MNQYQIHFEQEPVIELGGGSQPVFHPNADVREGENIDIVCDFNEPLSIGSESYGGVFSKFSIEHISFHNVKQHINEIYRILKKGGKAIIITANLLEQCRAIVEAGDNGFNEEFVCMIFGGQGEEGIEAGSHKCGFCPQYSIKVFADAGFSEVKVFEWPYAKTDMVIEAVK